jgi:endonuclease YncB( thermonuclease family)
MSTVSLESSIEELKQLIDADVKEYSLDGVECVGKIVDIYDGDTCRIILLLEGKYMKYTCRLYGIDTPEMKPALSKPNREEEMSSARKCRNRFIQLATNSVCPVDMTNLSKTELKQLMNRHTKVVKVICREFDKYGRLLISVYDQETNACVNDELVREGLAKAYFGGTKSAF